MPWPIVRSDRLTLYFKNGLRKTFHVEEWGGDITDNDVLFIVSLDNVSRLYDTKEIIYVESRPSFCWVGFN